MPADRLLTLGSRLRLVALVDGTDSCITVTRDQWLVLSQIPMCQRLGQICVRLKARPELVLEAAEELLAKGLVRIEMMQPSAAVVPLAEHQQRERALRRSA